MFEKIIARALEIKSARPKAAKGTKGTKAARKATAKP
jgi:hypothetical protein